MSQFTLHLVEGSVSFQFSADAARALKAELAQLMQTFKVVAASGEGANRGRPTPQSSLEYRSTGAVFFECFCNPNIWPSPFAAKALITVRDEHIRLTTEAELTQLNEDLNQFLEQY